MKSILGRNAERLTTEFRIVAVNEYGNDGFVKSARLVAEQGRNGLYSILKQVELYDNYSGCNGKNPSAFWRKFQASIVGYPKGYLDREVAIATLHAFEEKYVKRDENSPVKDGLKHYGNNFKI